MKRKIIDNDVKRLMLANVYLVLMLALALLKLSGCSYPTATPADMPRPVEMDNAIANPLSVLAGEWQRPLSSGDTRIWISVSNEIVAIANSKSITTFLGRIQTDRRILLHATSTDYLTVTIEKNAIEIEVTGTLCTELSGTWTSIPHHQE